MSDNLYITPLEIMRRMFAASTAFQTLTGAVATDNKTAAEVAYDDFTFEEFDVFADLPVFLVVGFSDEALNGSRDSQGRGIGAFKQSINFVCDLIVNTNQSPESEEWFAAAKTFKAAAGDILKGVLEECGKDGNFMLQTYSASRPFRHKEKQDETYLYIVFDFTTGT